MAQTNLSMTNEHIAAVFIVFFLNIGHFISGTVAPVFTVLTGVYILYNIRLQVVAAGGIKAYFKGWLKWK